MTNESLSLANQETRDAGCGGEEVPRCLGEGVTHDSLDLTDQELELVECEGGGELSTGKRGLSLASRETGGTECEEGGPRCTGGGVTYDGLSLANPQIQNIRCEGGGGLSTNKNGLSLAPEKCIGGGVNYDANDEWGKGGKRLLPKRIKEKLQWGAE